MEYRLTKLVSIILICSFINSCGYFSNDKTDFQIEIQGKIKAQKQENSNEVNLVFKESEAVYAGIIDDCSEIYHSPLNNEVLVKTKFNSSIEKFYKIKIVNENGKTVSNSLRKKIISKLIYESLINSSKKDFRKKFPNN